MDKYFQDFMEMVEALRAAPSVQLLNFALFDAATETDISRVEEAMGCSLDPPIRDFYRISNGLQLRWIHRRNPEFSPKRHAFSEGKFDYLEPLEEYAPEDGCVNILPLQVSLVDQDWGGIVWSDADQGEIEFAGHQRERLALMRAIKPLDVFAKSSSMVFLVEPGVGTPRVLLARDHFADVVGSRLTDFQSYLEFLLHHWGLVAARGFYKTYRGDMSPQLETRAGFWAEQPRPVLEGLYGS